MYLRPCCKVGQCWSSVHDQKPIHMHPLGDLRLKLSKFYIQSALYFKVSRDLIILSKSILKKEFE